MYAYQTLYVDDWEKTWILSYPTPQLFPLGFQYNMSRQSVYDVSSKVLPLIY